LFEFDVTSIHFCKEPALMGTCLFWCPAFG